ncbi:RDD family protein [Microbacterium sp. cx-59]|uniref:RDD family protein n=1 Tax=Microbacterium sp. cx-59 TaxID=2891207 RepID=UPI001E616F38|nr:RDD family protein [Microbacterium sp. cx-59]MCC4909375.1 RDD family protein [Microbacterium sp. cx-59]
MSLPPQFTGEPASVGARLAAFSIDVVILVIVGVVAWLLSGSPLFGLFLTAEAVLALWILQARTGVGPGKAMLGLRVARLDAPYSPGAGRSFVRGSLVALGGLVFAAGAWVVEGTAASDRSGLRRSWADKAAQTVVVAVPRRPRAERGRGRKGAASGVYSVPSPTIIARPWTPAAVPADKSRGATAADAAGPPPAAPWGSPLTLAPAPTAPADLGNTDQPVRPTGAVPLVAAEGADEALSGELLLIFDTGQRAQLPVPVAVNLGRNPEQTEATDAVLVVHDPDSSVSKTHLRLEHDRSGTWVTDAGSTNGTELIDDDGDARTLSPYVRTYVDDDTRIRIGNRVFTVSRLIGDLS